MQLKAGEYYKTRDGRKVGPMVREEYDPLPWTAGDARGWDANGKRYAAANCPGDDLVAVWSEGPVRQTYRTEIVPGKYGVLRLGAIGSSGVRVPVAFVDQGERFYSVDELTAAIATLTQVRDALVEVA